MPRWVGAGGALRRLVLLFGCGFPAAASISHTAQSHRDELLQQVRADIGANPAERELQRLGEAEAGAGPAQAATTAGATSSRPDHGDGDGAAANADADLDGDGDPSTFFGYATPRLYFEQMLTVHCEGGNEKQYHAHVDAGIDVDARSDTDGETCLIKAARQGHTAIVADALQERGANLNAAGFDGTTALLAASAAGHVGVVEQLLNASGARARRKAAPGGAGGRQQQQRRQRRHHASQFKKRRKITFARTTPGRRTAVRAALDGEESAPGGSGGGGGGDRGTGAPPAMAAEIVRLLARAGSPHLNLRAADGLTPLHVAARDGLLDVVRALARHGGDVNARAGDPDSDDGQVGGAAGVITVNGGSGEERQLSRAEQRRRRDVARTVARRATPLLLALEKHRNAVVDYLLFRAAEDRDAAVADSGDGDSGSFCDGDSNDGVDSNACVSASAVGAAVAQVDARLADTAGVGPLHAAAVTGNASIVRRLLELGADPNTPTLPGTGADTALLRACFFGHVETAAALLDGGALPNLADEHGTTPLMKASWYNRIDVVKLLLQRGAVSSIHRRSEHGATALSKAREWGNAEVVGLLEEAAAAFDETDPLAPRRRNRQAQRDRQEQRRLEKEQPPPPQQQQQQPAAQQGRQEL